MTVAARALCIQACSGNVHTCTWQMLGAETTKESMRQLNGIGQTQHTTARYRCMKEHSTHQTAASCINKQHSYTTKQRMIYTLMHDNIMRCTALHDRTWHCASSHRNTSDDRGFLDKPEPLHYLRSHDMTWNDLDRAHALVGAYSSRMHVCSHVYHRTTDHTMPVDIHYHIHSTCLQYNILHYATLQHNAYGISLVVVVIVRV